MQEFTFVTNRTTARRIRNNCKGFSIIEMVLSTLLVLSLSAVSYRVLKGLTSGQTIGINSQKQNSATSLAIDRFKRDMSMVDYNWVRYGVAAIYPHPGYSFDTNYYTDASIRQVEKLNDGVTLLQRDPTNDQIYEVDTLSRFCFPQAHYASDKNLYGDGLRLKTVNGLNVNDWVMIYEAGLYALGIVTNVNGSYMTVRMPNAIEEQSPSYNNSQSTGYIVKAGVSIANADIHYNVTSTVDDNHFCFEPANTHVQKMSSPVSYFVDYRTSDGEQKSVQNSYVLNQNGDKQKMLVRTQYSNGNAQREYVVPVEQVGFTYDELTDDTSIPGGIIKDLGRDDMANLPKLSNADPNQTGTNYESTDKIVAVKINITIPKSVATSGQITNQELKVAVNSSASDDLYQDTMKMVSSLTDNLKSKSPINFQHSTYDQSLGKPLYLSHPSAVDDEVVVPVTNFEITQANDIGSHSSGALNVYTSDGTPVNADLNGDPTAQSAIQFDLGPNSTFFPNTLNKTVFSDNSSRIFVGGMAVNETNGVVQRQPSLGIIDLAPGEKLADKLIQSGTGSCGNMTGCKVQVIDTSRPDMADLRDTANITVDQTTNDLFVTSMTKTIGQDSPSIVYHGQFNAGTGVYDFIKLGQLPGSDDGRVVTAMSDRMLQIGTDKYAAVCLTKKISDSCSGYGGGAGCLSSFIPGDNALQFIQNHNNNGTDSSGEFGDIQLVKYNHNTHQLESTHIKHHTWACSSINLDQDNNLLVTGREATQVISYDSLERAFRNNDFSGAQFHEPMYLDEVASVVNHVPTYADVFQIDPTTYDAHAVNKPQYIGWESISMAQMDDGTFKFVNANKYRLAANFGINHTSAPKEYANVGTEVINLAGMHDRVVATIQTDSTNINNSTITAVYTPQLHQLPIVYFPGTFLYDAANPRTTPTPLPLASPSMSEDSWVKLYKQLRSLNTTNDLNDQMPIYGATTQPVTGAANCAATLPQTICN